MKNKLLFTLGILFLFSVALSASDTIHFTTAGDTVVIDMENTGKSNTDIRDDGNDGKLFVCPNAGDYTVIYQLGAVDDGDSYEIHTPDEHFYEDFIHGHSMPGIMEFTKKKGTNTYKAYVEVVWLGSCPTSAPKPSGTDSLCANDSATYTITTFTNANYFKWYVIPTNSGYIDDTDTIGTLHPNIHYSGESEITVMAIKGIPDDGNEVLSKTKTIYLVGAPTADFNYNIDSMQITLDNLSTNADKYLWDFGDSQTDTAKNPKHMYQAGGDYTIQLVADNSCMVDTVEKNIVITKLEEDVKDNCIHVYPTLVSKNSITIKTVCAFSQPIKLTIFNSIGKIVDNKMLNNNVNIVDVSGLNNGMYILSIQYNNKEYVRKIVIRCQ